MANFFNELGKKLSDVGSTAMQKTKEFSDITKLNSAVAEEERNQGNLFTQLGKIYFDQHQDAPEDLYKDTVEALKSSMSKVAELKEQLRRCVPAKIAGRKSQMMRHSARNAVPNCRRS